MKLKVGQKFEVDLVYTQDHVNQFIAITGDDNPIHHDHHYASGTIFQKPIIHGLLSASVFSKIFGTTFPGEGTIYMSQNLNFHKPMFVEEPYVAVVEFVESFPQKRRGRFATLVLDQRGEITLSGEALLYHREKL